MGTATTWTIGRTKVEEGAPQVGQKTVLLPTLTTLPVIDKVRINTITAKARISHEIITIHVNGIRIPHDNKANDKASVTHRALHYQLDLESSI